MASNKDDIEKILAATLEDLGKRGENLDKLQSSADQLECGSAQLAHDARALSQQKQEEFDRLYLLSGGAVLDKAKDTAKKTSAKVIAALSPRSLPKDDTLPDQPNAAEKKEKKPKKEKTHKKKDKKDKAYLSADDGRDKQKKKHKKSKKTQPEKNHSDSEFVPVANNPLQLALPANDSPRQAHKPNILQQAIAAVSPRPKAKPLTSEARLTEPLGKSPRLAPQASPRSLGKSPIIQKKSSPRPAYNALADYKPVDPSPLMGKQAEDAGIQEGASSSTPRDWQQRPPAPPSTYQAPVSNVAVTVAKGNNPPGPSFATPKSVPTKSTEPNFSKPKRSVWKIVAGVMIGILALGVGGVGFGLTFTGILMPLGMAMQWGGIWLASAAAGLAGITLAALTGIILNEIIHGLYDYAISSDDDNLTQDLVISAPIKGSAPFSKSVVATTPTTVPVIEKKSSCDWFLCNWWQGDKKQLAKATDDTQQSLIPKSDGSKANSR